MWKEQFLLQRKSWYWDRRAPCGEVLHWPPSSGCLRHQCGAAGGRTNHELSTVPKAWLNPGGGEGGREDYFGAVDPAVPPPPRKRWRLGQAAIL